MIRAPSSGRARDELLESPHHVVEGEVEVGVVELDVRDDGGLRSEVEERAVALVRLGHDEVRPTEGHVAPDVVKLAAHEGRRVLAQRPQDVRRHAGRRGLAVGPGHRDAAVALQDPGQGGRPGYDGDRTPVASRSSGLVFGMAVEITTLGVADLVWRRARCGR